MKPGHSIPVTLLALVLGAAAGLAISATADRAGSHSGTVSLKNVSAAVQTAIMAEVMQELFELEIEETADGFDVEFESDEKEVELQIARDGTIISKEVAREDDDDEGDGDMEEDDDDDDDDD